MSDSMSDFICPICKEKLVFFKKNASCKNGHNFDIAKEGYINLLMSNKMHSKNPGDTKDMVLSRRHFFQKGYYNIFSRSLNEIIEKYAFDGMHILDAGSGEGTYTDNLYKYVKSIYKDCVISGFDISKFAVKSASKLNSNINFAVASIFDIPIKDNSQDFVISIFSPIVDSEFCRLLKNGGKLIIAVPGEYHLWGLKILAYDAPYINEHKKTNYAGFKFIERISVKDEIHLDNNEDILNLFSMTPYYWKTDIKGSQKVINCNNLDTQIHFDFIIYEKI